MVYIYVLKLRGGRYYVGKTDNPKFRLADHFKGAGSTWTKKYEPIEVVSITEGDDFDEDKYTLKYMKQYGIDNVRGGSFCQVILSPSDLDTINKMLHSAKNQCFRCGRTNHMIKDCYAKTKIDGTPLPLSSSSSDDEEASCIIN